jgi:hypothetical protein
MLQRYSIAAGAGLAAGILFAVMAKGTLLSYVLALLSPLPLVIATLGWGLDIGAIAGAIAGIVVAALFNPASGGIFAVTIALPAWLLSSAAALPRRRLFAGGVAVGQASWFPVGWIVTLAALLCALIGATLIGSLIVGYGGYQKGVDAAVAELLPALKTYEDMLALPAGITFEAFVATAVRLSPATFATLACVVFCANLYAGARAVQLSQRLTRPWPNLPESLVLPRFLGIGLIACAGLVLLLRGPGVYVAWIGVAVLSCIYAMQGLAVIHSLSRGLAVRIPALVAFYFGCLVTGGWALPALALVGLVESLLALRARRAAAANAKSRNNESKGEKKWK